MNNRLYLVSGAVPWMRLRVALRSVAYVLACVCALAATPMAHAQVEVSIIATDAQPSETPADNGQFVVRRTGGSFIPPVTVTYTVSGTATPGDDYAPLSGSILLPVLQSDAAITVAVTGDDGVFEGDETVTVTLVEQPSSGYTVGTGTATVTIADSTHSVTVADSSNAAEGTVSDGEVTLSLGARNESGADLAIEYSVAGSAEPGTDYDALSGVAVLPIGSSTTSITVSPLADDLLEGDETVDVTLTASSDARAPIGAPATGRVVIEDDEAVGDEDGDGLTNLAECPDFSPCPDTDGDGALDYQDPDDDGDGVPTASENPPDQDTDADGNPDYLDDDDDGDGRLTRDEDLNEDGDGNPATDPTDLDGDDIPDYLDPDDQGGPGGDLDGDGLTNEREEELGTDPENPDTDGDGVRDGDEDAAGTDPLDHTSFEDSDGDLVPDAIEALDDTDPNDPDSVADFDSGGTPDYVETFAYSNYGIEQSDVTDPRDDRRDFDGDGLPDRLEIRIGSDPATADAPTADGAGDDSGNGVSNAVEEYLASVGISSVDTVSDFDHDGVPDAAEVALGLNPLSGTEKDADGDGVPDVVELLAGLDIDAATDSDGDGVPDAREIALGSDPLDANFPVANGALDDDGDGVSNAIEQVLQMLGVSEDPDGSSDSDGDGLSDADEIRFGGDPSRDEQPAPWVALAQADIGPVSALVPTGGMATATAVVAGHQSGTLLYDWGDSDNAVLAVVSGGQTERTMTFSPQTLPPGPYTLVVNIQRMLGGYESAVSTIEFTLSVLEDAEAADVADADNDGIPDPADDRDARTGFANELHAQAGEQLRADAGVRLQLGTIARTARATSALITRGDIAGAGDGNGGSAGNSEDDFDYVSGIYDFEVTNLPEPGGIVQVVIPQAMPIGEFPEYRKFQPGSGWVDYVEDTNNLVESAAGSSGACPEPGDDSYQPGLTSGHSCIQLTIEDGGPNDGDAHLGPNGVIKDPGGVATPKGQVSVGEGSGSFGPAALVLLGLFSLRRLLRSRGVAPGATAALAVSCCCLLALPASTRADVFAGVGAGLSSLDPETAGTPFSSVDDQDFGYKVFGGIDLTPISRNLAVEAFWADLGQATLNNGGMIDYSLYGAGVMYGIGSVREPRLSGFIEAGVARLDINANVPFQQEDDTSLFFSIAGAFAIRRHWFLQLEYDYYTSDAQFLSLSIVKRFRLDQSARPQTYPLPPD